MPDSAALADTQGILIGCGAISCGVYQLLQLSERAQTALRAIPLRHPAELGTLLEELNRPVRGLMEVVKQREEE
jgi:hypothetical protein